jgi:hypothetical protein
MISAKSKEFMQNGIKEIVESSIGEIGGGGGVKLAECRNI